MTKAELINELSAYPDDMEIQVNVRLYDRRGGESANYLDIDKVERSYICVDLV